MIRYIGIALIFVSVLIYCVQAIYRGENDPRLALIWFAVMIVNFFLLYLARRADREREP